MAKIFLFLFLNNRSYVNFIYICRPLYRGTLVCGSTSLVQCRVDKVNIILYSAICLRAQIASGKHVVSLSAKRSSLYVIIVHLIRLLTFKWIKVHFKHITMTIMVLYIIFIT